MSVELIANLLLALLAVAVAISLFRFHNNTHYRHFNLVDVITCHKGKVSRPALMEFGAWLIATWGFVVLVNKGQLTDWYMVGYIGAFVARAGHAAYLSTTMNKPEK